MLPSIANYFGVTVDALLSNDNSSKEKDKEFFYEKLGTLDWKDSTQRIDFVREYCRKYPENVVQADRIKVKINAPWILIF